MVYVTHDQVEAMTMADRIVIMNRGEICQVGTPLEVYSKPANRFVASFIGTPPMNFFTGRLEAGTAGPVVVLEGGLRLPIPRQDLAAHYGNAVVLGVRPERVALGGDAHPHAARVSAVVDEVEPLGHDVIVSARCEAGPFQMVAEIY
jgi:multiple sugar transport system ATP-binding protein